MKKILAFINGFKEFKMNCTTHYDSDLIEYYDMGRELMHRITFRRFDH